LISIPPSAWVEAESFIALIRHGRTTVDEARRDIGVDDHRRAELTAWIRTMPAECRITLHNGLTVYHPFSASDLAFRDRVGLAFEILLADTGVDTVQASKLTYCSFSEEEEACARGVSQRDPSFDAWSVPA
jgi:hypothetical protein